MELKGSLVRDITRVSVGRVQDVLLDPDTLDARWLQVILDADGRTVLVPAVAASECAPGELLVPYTGDSITSAVHAEGAALGESDALRLMRHYGFSV